MKIYFDNVNFQANNGPNNYAQKLARKLTKKGHQIVAANEKPDAQISFIQINQKVAPTVLRLDGIYFNSEQNWKQLNAPIKDSYLKADAVVFQSEYNRDLVHHHFGDRSNVLDRVISNGTCYDIIETIDPYDLKSANIQKPSSENWCCASHWRPHKRLLENVRYFLKHAPADSNFWIMGKSNSDAEMQEAISLAPGRVFYVGELQWSKMISVMKSCSTFIHLAWLDHCPNVVVDALAAGCHAVVSSSGGTSEIPKWWHGTYTSIYDEQTFGPTKLYQPPKLDLDRKYTVETSVPAAFQSKLEDEEYMNSVTIDRDVNGYELLLKDMLLKLEA